MPDETIPSNLIAETLVLPNDLKGYHIGRELAQLFPDKAVLQCSENSFSLDEFVEGGHCTITVRPEIYRQFVLTFRGADEDLYESEQNAWFEVEWQNRTLEVVLTEQCAVLREQMHAMNLISPAETEIEMDSEFVIEE